MDDLISRQALMKEFSDFVRESNNSDFAPTPIWNDAVSLVASMPSAERREGQPSECEYWDDESNFCTLNRPSAERHGRWIDVEHAPDNLFYATCSVCGDRQTIEVANYCPMCGASMDEVLSENR